MSWKSEIVPLSIFLFFMGKNIGCALPLLKNSWDRLWPWRDKVGLKMDGWLATHCKIEEWRNHPQSREKHWSGYLPPVPSRYLTIFEKVCYSFDARPFDWFPIPCASISILSHVESIPWLLKYVDDSHPCGKPVTCGSPEKNLSF